MTVTKGDLVSGAYRAYMRISGLTTKASPEEIQLALEQADDLAAQMKADGWDLGWNYPDNYGSSLPSDNSGLTREMAGPFKVKLSEYLLQAFGKPITQSLAMQIRAAENTLNQLLVDVAPADNPPTLPIGSGNEWRRTDRYFYPEPAANEDAIYLYKGSTFNYSRNFTQNPNWLLNEALTSVEWSFGVQSGVTIANKAFDDTTTSADITFNQIGGYTLCITVTKTNSNEVFIVEQNFIIQECQNNGAYLYP